MKMLFIMAVSSFIIFLPLGCGGSDAVNLFPSQKQEASAGADENILHGVKASGSKLSDINEKKILVAYFSYTGNTRRAAEQIHGLVGGDLVEIKTVRPYPAEMAECIAIARREREMNARPAISTKIDNINNYDVVFVGYPIWGHTVPMAIYNFLESYNLSGKTVIPFCTSASSGFSESMPAIQSLCPNSKILEGVRANDPKKVEEWLSRIGMR